MWRMPRNIVLGFLSLVVLSKCEFPANTTCTLGYNYQVENRRIFYNTILAIQPSSPYWYESDISKGS